MLHTVSHSPLLSPVVSDSLAETSLGDPLLGLAGCVAGSHALVIAPNGLDLMCRLLRLGCAAVTTLRPSERAEHELYDLVIAPTLASSAAIGQLVHQAKRALLPAGRVLAVVPIALAEADPGAVALLVRSIRLGGFVAVHTKVVADGILVRGDLPRIGRSQSVPMRRRQLA